MGSPIDSDDMGANQRQGMVCYAVLDVVSTIDQGDVRSTYILSGYCRFGWNQKLSILENHQQNRSSKFHI